MCSVQRSEALQHDLFGKQMVMPVMLAQIDMLATPQCLCHDERLTDTTAFPCRSKS